MREILCRGKRLDNGEWVEGWYQPETTIKHWNGIQETIGVTIAYKAEDGYLEDTLVDPPTVGQYTGLTDKNGKRIFEGDIVKTSDITHEGVIQILGELFEIAMRKGCLVMVSGEDWDFLETNHECIQVIGNIHDNQELLKGGEG